jgi:hypothetical protein
VRKFNHRVDLDGPVERVGLGVAGQLGCLLERLVGAWCEVNGHPVQAALLSRPWHAVTYPRASTATDVLVADLLAQDSPAGARWRRPPRQHEAGGDAMGSGTVGMDVFRSASADRAQRALGALRP